MRTHYDVLGVAPSASAEEIRACYRRLVMKYHPDRHQGNPLSDLAEAELAALNEAHDVLTDAGRRAAYDAKLASGAAQGAGVGGASAVAREKKTLAVLLRALSIVVALLLLVRFVPVLGRAGAEMWQVLAGSLAALGGAPAVAMGALAAVAVVLIVRRVRRRTGTGRRRNT